MIYFRFFFTVWVPLSIKRASSGWINDSHTHTTAINGHIVCFRVRITRQMGNPRPWLTRPFLLIIICIPFGLIIQKNRIALVASDQWDRGFNIWDPFMELFHNKTQDRYRKYAQPLILMIGAANQRDECVDRLTCQLSSYVPDFQLRPVALV